MTQTIIHKVFSPIKKLLPAWLSNPIRGAATAFLTPILYSYRTGHFLSSIKMAAVSRTGEPLPWYTYPIIDFLKYRDYRSKVILEFGGGQSTLWWADRAKQVITCEGDRSWYEKILKTMPRNVNLNYVSMESAQVNVSQVRDVLRVRSHDKFDVIVIDGLYREEMVKIALDVVAEDGIIICDNAEGYGFYDEFTRSGMRRVDFYGNAPGVVLPHCTSLYFWPTSFVFDPAVHIHVIAVE